MLDTHCRNNGIFAIGNINPLNMTVGSNIPISETNIATCCVFVLMEMKIPNVRQVIMNNALSANNNSQLPSTGIRSTNTLISTMDSTLMSESNKYGTAFDRMTHAGLNGDTNSTSIVPVSFSLTMAMAVIITETSINTKAMTPGTKLGAPLSWGL